MISQEKQIELIKSYKDSGDENILLEIINSNIKLIKKIANICHRQNKHCSLDDLVSCGYEGIILAIKKFNPEKNDLFFLYAKTWIYAKMREFLLKNVSSLSVSGKDGRNFFSNYYKSDEKQFENKDGFSAFKNAIVYTASLDSSKKEDEIGVLVEEKISSSSLPLDEELDKKNAKMKFLNELIEFEKTLPEIEKSVITLRLLTETPKTLSQISTQFNCSNQSIFYLEKKIIKSLKKRIFNSNNKELYHLILE